MEIRVGLSVSSVVEQIMKKKKDLQCHKYYKYALKRDLLVARNLHKM